MFKEFGCCSVEFIVQYEESFSNVRVGDHENSQSNCTGEGRPLAAAECSWDFQLNDEGGVGLRAVDNHGEGLSLEGQ